MRTPHAYGRTLSQLLNLSALESGHWWCCSCVGTINFELESQSAVCVYPQHHAFAIAALFAYKLASRQMHWYQYQPYAVARLCHQRQLHGIFYIKKVM